MLASSTVPQFALVLPGEAMFVAFQAGAAMELVQELQAQGYGDHPIDTIVGSSSGTLVATTICAGAPFDHVVTQEGLIEFGNDTRFTRPRRSANPYPGALDKILKRGFANTAAAMASPSRLIVTASHYESGKMSAMGREALSLSRAGLKMLVSGPCENSCTYLANHTASLLELGSRMFLPRYFSNKAWPERQEQHPEEDWVIARDKDELLDAVYASTRIPILYGAPIYHGAHALIDGVFANNAPVELALETGARNVFVINSSRSGHVFDRPVQSLVCHQLRLRLLHLEGQLRFAKPFPKGRRARAALKEIAQLRRLIPKPKPLDLAALEKRYPGQRIHVIHPKDPPAVNRFFESNPQVLEELYDLGRQETQSALRKVNLAA